MTQLVALCDGLGVSPNELLGVAPSWASRPAAAVAEPPAPAYVQLGDRTDSETAIGLLHELRELLGVLLERVRCDMRAQPYAGWAAFDARDLLAKLQALPFPRRRDGAQG